MDIVPNDDPVITGFTTKTRRVAAAAFAGTLMAALSPTEAGSWSDAVTPVLDLRYRFERADDASRPRNGNGHTLRARAGFDVSLSERISMLAEAEAVWHLGQSDYDDTVNGRSAFPVIADPETLELNRLQIAYTGDEVQATLGRQRINLDNQRFIGGSAFRQNEQTFDALRLSYTGVSRLTVDYAFVTRVNRVFGQRSPAGDFTGETHLIDISYGDGGLGGAGAFAYLLDLEDAPLLSTATYGARLSGSLDLAERAALAYRLVGALQEPYGRNPAHGTLGYLQAEARLSWRGASVTVGQERLAGNGSRGFSTPLGSLHGFQGFADLFMTTPADGIVDSYAGVGFDRFVAWEPVTRISAQLMAHDFEAERADASYGSELDAELTLTLSEGFTLSAAYARFDSDGPLYPDTERFWLSAAWSL